MSEASQRDSSDALVTGCQAGMAVTGIAWLLMGEYPEAVVAAVALALSVAPGRAIVNAPLRTATRSVTAVLLATHVVVGMGLGLYDSSILYDKVMHALGIGAITVVLLIATQHYCEQHRLELPLPLTACLVLCAAVTAGTAWELFEFSVDLTGVFIAQRGLHDTMLDLAADTAGAVLVVVGFVASRGMDEAVLARG